MTPLVFIDGDQGTTGLQVQQWLAGRNDLRLLQLPPEHRKSAAHRAEALNDCDVALLCLPDEAAREAVALVRRPGVRVIDASSAHRTAPGWVYGLPELAAAQAARIAGAQRVSNPAATPRGRSPCSGPWSTRACCRRLSAGHPRGVGLFRQGSGRARGS
jgi:N-acetyl-gamma-glutamyl-phosphate reductase